MNAEQLLAQYERIADAPDAVERLRRFVRDLAVRGKLMEQSERDEPAFEQLARIALAKTTVNRAQRAKRTEDHSHLLADSAEDLPRGWAVAPLSDLVAVLNGRAYKQHELLGSGTPVLRVGNLFTSDKWYYSDLSLDDDKYCDSGDLIYSWSASFGPFIWNGGRVIYHYHIWKLSLFSEVDLSKQFLYQVLLQKTRAIKESGHGVSMIHMTKEKMERIPIWLPPLAEQHRIAAKVNELMALCDRLEAARAHREATRDRLTVATLARLNSPESAASTDNEAPKAPSFQSHARFALNVLPALTTRPGQIKHLRQTILNLAVRGKLVPQDASEKEAAATLSVVATEIPSPKVNQLLPRNEPYEVPANWRWVCFGSLIAQSDSGWSPKTESHPRTGALWGVLKVSAVSWGRFRPNENKQVLPNTEARNQAVVRKGDFLLSRANTAELVARAVIVDDDPVNLMLSDKIVRLTLTQHCNSGFLLLVNNHAEFARLHYATRASGVSPSMKNISRDVIYELPIPFPPLAEQERIVAKVDELIALCDQLEASLQRGERTRGRLLDALLHEALAPTASTLEAA
jgi:type I restriction enzyme S subunit